MSQGKDFLVAFSATSAGVKADVEFQGDLTINTGKSVSANVYKNGQEAGQTSQGFSISFNMGNQAPLATVEALIWGSHESGTLGYWEITNAVTGGVEWTFAGRCAITTVTAPTSGVTTVQVTVVAEGAVTRGAAA